MLLPLTWMVSPTMNLISRTHHSYERREHVFMILRKYIIIFWDQPISILKQNPVGNKWDGNGPFKRVKPLKSSPMGFWTSPWVSRFGPSGSSPRPYQRGDPASNILSSTLCALIRANWYLGWLIEFTNGKKSLGLGWHWHQWYYWYLGWLIESSNRRKSLG